jgi:hypothetical protein
LWNNVDFLKQNFIPVVHVDNPGQTMCGEFLKRLGRHFSNEIAVVTPNGRLLSEYPAQGLALWKQLPVSERKRLDDLGKYDPQSDPVPPPNGLILNVYARTLRRDPSGRLQYYQGAAASTLEPGRDHLWLTEKEWQSLLPKQADVGQKYDVAEPILQRLCLRCLLRPASVDGFQGVRPPQELFAKKLQAIVEENSPARIRLRFDGSCRLESNRPGQAAAADAKGDFYQLRGYLHYDVKKKAVSRFDLVAFSETGYYDKDSTIKVVTPFGVAFELSKGESDMERFPPSGFSPKEYFGEVAPK